MIAPREIIDQIQAAAIWVQIRKIHTWEDFQLYGLQIYCDPEQYHRWGCRSSTAIYELLHPELLTLQERIERRWVLHHCPIECIEFHPYPEATIIAETYRVRICLLDNPDWALIRECMEHRNGEIEGHIHIINDRIETFESHSQGERYRVSQELYWFHPPAEPEPPTMPSHWDIARHLNNFAIGTVNSEQRSILTGEPIVQSAPETPDPPPSRSNRSWFANRWSQLTSRDAS